MKGEWVYLYRAVDRAGQTVDFLLSEHHAIAAAKRFFAQAIEKRGVPDKITLDRFANCTRTTQDCLCLLSPVSLSWMITPTIG